MNYKKFGIIGLILLLCCTSYFYLGSKFSQVDAYTNIVESLDAKKQDVLLLTASTTAASATVTLLPGDIATPIADKLADFSQDFLIVLTAIYLEKYLLTVIGFAAFKVIIPIGLFIYLLDYLFNKDRTFKRIASKLVIFGFMITLVIPVSVKISDMIENTYQLSYSANISQEIVEEAPIIEEETPQEELSFWDSITQTISGSLESLAQSATEATTQITEETTLIINKFIESVAIMLVTSCVIPVLVFLTFVWLARVLLEINIPTFSAHQIRSMVQSQINESL